MNKWIKGFLQLASVGCFIWGAMFIPFGVWASGSQGSNPVVGWVIYLASILIPWSIGYMLARLSVSDRNS